MTFSNPETALVSTPEANQLNQHWQANCLRVRPRPSPGQQPPLTSTPIPRRINQYARKGGMMFHRPQTCYYNYPNITQVSSAATGLTQVLSTYVPGTTVLYLDPKEKPTVGFAPRFRLALITVVVAVLLLGLTVGMRGILSFEAGTASPKVSEQKNSSDNFVPQQPGVSQQKKVPEPRMPMQQNPQLATPRREPPNRQHPGQYPMPGSHNSAPEKRHVPESRHQTPQWRQPPPEAYTGPGKRSPTIPERQQPVSQNFKNIEKQQPINEKRNQILEQQQIPERRQQIPERQQKPELQANDPQRPSVSFQRTESRSFETPPPRFLFSFDDADLDNEARVETI